MVEVWAEVAEDGGAEDDAGDDFAQDGGLSELSAGLSEDACEAEEDGDREEEFGDVCRRERGFFACGEEGCEGIDQGHAEVRGR